MKLQLGDWWPWYRRIIETFGYSQAQDQQAADLLSALLKDKTLDVSELARRIQNRPVLVFGAGPSLEQDLKQVMCEGVIGRFATVVADGATSALLHLANVVPDIVVTDLDGVVRDIVSAQMQGAAVVIHAHGDNMGQLERYVPEFSRAVGSTQVEPRLGVYNFFGFTDGDRAVFLAAAFGAKSVVLAGMDFGLNVGKYSKQQVKSLAVKREKMRIGRELLEWLAKKTRGTVKLYNLTSSGDDIAGFQRIQPPQLEEIV